MEVRAICENVVFRPMVPVDLPEGCEVEFSAVVVKEEIQQGHREEHRPQFGSAVGLIHMSEDFDEPAADFQEYME